MRQPNSLGTLLKKPFVFLTVVILSISLGVAFGMTFSSFLVIPTTSTVTHTSSTVTPSSNVPSSVAVSTSSTVSPTTSTSSPSSSTAAPTSSTVTPLGIGETASTVTPSSNVPSSVAVSTSSTVIPTSSRINSTVSIGNATLSHITPTSPSLLTGTSTGPSASTVTPSTNSISGSNTAISPTSSTVTPTSPSLLTGTSTGPSASTVTPSTNMLTGTSTPPPSTGTLTSPSGPVSFSTSSGGFTSLSASTTPGSGLQVPGGTYPYGFFSWTISGFSGTSVTVTMLFPGPVPFGSLWVKASGNSITPSPVPGNPDAISITIQDNGPYDENPVVGVISDPAGLMVPTGGKVTGGGKIGDKINFGFEVNSDLDSKKETTGNLEYQDKSANMKFHSDKISFLSVTSTGSEATIVGTTNDDMQDKHGTQGSNHIFLATISDPDKTGNHDTFSIKVTDSTGNVVYQKSGTVQGHIEIHKITT